MPRLSDGPGCADGVGRRKGDRMTKDWKGDQSLKEAPDLAGEVGAKVEKRHVKVNVTWTDSRVIDGHIYMRMPVGLSREERDQRAKEYLKTFPPPEMLIFDTDKAEDRTVLSVEAVCYTDEPWG